ncbi:MAG: rhomboid family intramembrane serine protease [Culicoidibacterales bacterium]
MQTWDKWTITNTCIALCSLIFIVMTFAGGSENVYVLLEFGAMQNQLVANGQVWRLLTANVIHIGFFHLLMNMVIYYQFGNLLESVLKKWQYITILFVSMITTTGATYLFGSAYGLSAGWSGVLFGVMGAFIVLSYAFPQQFRNYSKQVIIPILGVNILIGFIDSSINWLGHFGGFFGGFLAMGIVALIIKRQKK